MSHKNAISSQTSSTVKPVSLNLQARPFAPLEKPQVESSSNEQDEETKENPRYSENLLARIINAPTSESTTPVQRRLENRLKVGKVSGIPIQTKLVIGEPNDKYEKEADDVAATVVQQINTSTNITAVDNQPIQNQPVQRQEEVEEENDKEEGFTGKEFSMSPEPPPIQRKGMVSNRLKMTMLQKREHVGGGVSSTDLESSIQSARGSGQSLDGSLSEKLGQAMGADFSGVKVHTDSQSDQLNKSIQAKAFTTGQDVFFRQGAYDPSSRGGQELIAHELTHVVQQNGGAVQRSPETYENVAPNFIQRTSVKVKGVKVGKTRLYNSNGIVVGNVAKGTILDINDDDTFIVGGRTLVKIYESSADTLNLKSAVDTDDVWISSTRYDALAVESVDLDNEEDDIESIGAIALDDEEDGDSIAVGRDGVKITIAGKEIVLSRSKIQASGGVEKSVGVSEEYSVTFPVPLGPLAPLALTFSLGFKAGVGATLTMTGVVTRTAAGSGIHVEGTGTAKAEAEANVGVGLGISAGVATVAGELQAALGAEATGELKVQGDAAAGSDLVNAGTKADVSLSGAIKAAVNGVAKLTIAIFSKEFKVTFKEWELAKYDWTKSIADIGQSEPFLPTKSELGLNDGEAKDLYKAMDPMPTATQKRWVSKILKDYDTAKKAADKLKSQGVNIEDPDFWAVIDAYETRTVYTIRGGKIIKATASEAMPLMASHLAEQMVNLREIDE
jgi:hypothetical protein